PLSPPLWRCSAPLRLQSTAGWTHDALGEVELAAPVALAQRCAGVLVGVGDDHLDTVGVDVHPDRADADVGCLEVVDVRGHPILEGAEGRLCVLGSEGAHMALHPGVPTQGG